jgi:ribonuclease BN (tRNA processing enzyme)
VRLTVLGSQGTWPGAGRECCGYVVTSDGFHLWLDAGTGTFSRLQEHVPVGDLGGMLISHGHADHFLDIIPAFYARHYGGLGEPGLPFYSPPGFTDLAALLVSESGRNVMAEAYAFSQIAHGDVFEIGPFRVVPFEMTHIGVPSLGYRIEAEGKVLAYTGDTGPCDNAVDLARDCDLFLCEATYQNSSELTFFHLSADQAAKHAEAAGAGRLVLTHITPNLDPGISLEEAAEGFRGAIDVAVPDMVIEVGA